MTAGNASLPASGGGDAVIFDAIVDGGACTTYMLTNPDTVNSAMVLVSGLHKAGEYFPILPGQTIPFRNGANGITKIVGHSSSNSAPVVVSGGIESKL